MRIENWSLCEKDKELPLLYGNIYGDKRYRDGTLIYTDKIISRVGDVAIDIHGRRIELGKQSSSRG